MGSYHLGPDEPYALALAERYGIDSFVETGTWRGGTSTWAAKHFDRVITIEAHRPRFEKTTAAYAGQFPNLSFWFGDSRVLLAKALREMDQPVLLYLDAHWCGGGAKEAYAMGDECPLAEELAAINASQYAEKHVIMIDDARLFTAPPPYPHDPAQWLTYDAIVALLPGRDVWIDKDIIYALPR